MKITTTIFALGLVLAAAASSTPAASYDPCQLAQQDRIVKRDAMNRYINNQCPATARYIPADCRYPQHGWDLLNALRQATARVQRECNT